jgi:acetyltransferase-like isoleucine patch superfamily enzyme
VGARNDVRRIAGRGALGAYRLAVRVRAKAFSVLSAGAFESFGAQSVLQPPIRVAGEHRIAVGTGVFVGAGAWLQVLAGPDGGEGRIELGDGTSLAGGCVLSSAAEVRLGRRVLFARNVYVADHRHAFADGTRAVLDQGIEQVAPVSIGDGAWLGENVVVGPGVTIGRGAVIGANAVVLGDVPERAVAVGAPARVVRQLDDDAS